MDFRDFEEFFPYYVGQHGKAATRWVHLAGTLSGTVVGVGLLAKGRWRGVALMPVFSYGAAWASHFFIEKNKPASWGHPGWSFRGDMRMIRMMLAGRDAELDRMGKAYRNSTPDADPVDQVLAA